MADAPGEITAIASYLATRIQSDGVDPVEATEAWRSTLRYARRTGAIEPLAELLERSEPEDDVLRKHCDTLRR
jgi:hypothetical protein